MAAQEKGVLHLDLKPANIMIDGRGRALITDFSIAVSRPDEITPGAGTPAYMAPEQVMGRELTVQTDLYALGLNPTNFGTVFSPIGRGFPIGKSPGITAEGNEGAAGAATPRRSK